MEIKKAQEAKDLSLAKEWEDIVDTIEAKILRGYMFADFLPLISKENTCKLEKSGYRVELTNIYDRLGKVEKYTRVSWD